MILVKARARAHALKHRSLTRELCVATKSCAFLRIVRTLFRDAFKDRALPNFIVDGGYSMNTTRAENPVT